MVVKVKVKSMSVDLLNKCTCRFEGCDCINVGGKKISIGIDDRINPTQVYLFDDNVDYEINRDLFDFISNHLKEDLFVTIDQIEENDNKDENEGSNDETADKKDKNSIITGVVLIYDK